MEYNPDQHARVAIGMDRLSRLKGAKGSLASLDAQRARRIGERNRARTLEIQSVLTTIKRVELRRVANTESVLSRFSPS